MTVTLSKWGNSLAVRIPKERLDDLNAREGDRLEVVVNGGRLVLTPTSAAPRLGELLAEITKDNRHAALFDDLPGAEAW